ncbi:unnamed protein product [Effrenium voratum]|uniref:PDZ domain-containing protein n=1 Tax=Effrenium voratum TaxID=2562239 RepID=A0AA36MH55_9DINO|nr:unnamed protein product [Effrenium voratum]
MPKDAAMADGFGGWLKSTAASLEGHVKEIRENSKLIAADVASNVNLEKAGRKIQQTFGGSGVLAPAGLEEVRIDVTFQEGSLGLNLDLANGGQVIKITPGGQADALGLRLEDRVVAIAGDPLPSEDFSERLKQRLKLPRPVDMTFLRMQERKRNQKEEKEEKDEKEEKKEPEAVSEITDLQAKLETALKDVESAKQEAGSLTAELQLRKSWAAQEAAELEALRAGAEVLKAAKEEADKGKISLQTAIKEAENRASQSAQCLEKERVKLEAATESLAAAQSEQAALRERLQAAEHSLRDRDSVLAAEGDEKTAQLQSSLAELQRSYDEADTRRRCVEEQLRQAENRNRDSEASIRVAEDRASQSAQCLEKERVKLEAATESLAAAQSEQAALRERLQAAEHSLRDRDSVLAAEGDEKTAQLQSSLAELQRSYDEADTRRRHVEEQLRQAENRNRDSEASIRVAEDRASQSAQCLEKERVKLEAATESLAAAQSEQAALRERLQVLEQQLEASEARFSEQARTHERTSRRRGGCWSSSWRRPRPPARSSAPSCRGPRQSSKRRTSGRDAPKSWSREKCLRGWPSSSRSWWSYVPSCVSCGWTGTVSRRSSARPRPTSARARTTCSCRKALGRRRLTWLRRHGCLSPTVGSRRCRPGLASWRRRTPR